MKSYAERIKYAMQLRGVTQAELVRRTNINKGAISSYLSGNYNPKQESIYLIAKALNVSETWLMGLTDDLERDFVKQNHFDNIDEAMIFLLSNPVVSAYGGYDFDRMSDDEKVQFANKMAGVLKMLAEDYKK